MHNNTCLNKKSQPLVCSVKTPEGKLQVNMLHDFSHYVPITSKVVQIINLTTRQTWQVIWSQDGSEIITIIMHVHVAL